MLDEKDLQAIAQLMEQQRKDILSETKDLMAQQRKDILSETKDLMAQQRKDILHDVKILLDTEVTTKFNLLAEGMEDIRRRMPSEDDMDIIDGRLDTLEAMVKKHSREIAELKKAQ